MRAVILASALALGCSPDNLLPRVTDTGGSASGAAAAGMAGEPTRGGAEAGGGSAAVGTGGTAGEAELPPDNYDDGGCEHPQVEAACVDGWCKIPPGCFIMGSPENEWSHAPQEQRVKVTLTRGFEIGEHEVTQAEWTALGLANPSEVITEGDGKGIGDCSEAECPVGNVTWFEAATYANLLSDQQGLPRCYELQGCVNEIGTAPTGLVCEDFGITTDSIYDCTGFRLPTDPEWEYAARAGTRTAYYSGDITTQLGSGACAHEPALSSVAWYCDNAGPLTHPVAQLQPNAWGLFDTLGNAAEWVNDQGGWVPATETLTNPDQTFGPGAARDVRGCAHFGWPSLCRVALRLGYPGDFRSVGRGFRVARTLGE